MSLDDFSTNDYQVSIGEHESLAIYQIINREHGVMEYQDHLLPRVLDTLGELQERLDAARLKLSAAAPMGGASSVLQGKFPKSDGEDGLH